MPLTADLSKFRLAPAAAFFNGVYLGEVSYDTPIEIVDDVKDTPMKSARLGKVDATITDHDCFVMVPVVEVTPDKLALAIPGSTLVGGQVTVSYQPGVTLRQFAGELRIARIVNNDASTDPDDNFVFSQASPAPGSVSQKFDAAKQQEFVIKFQAWPDLTTGELYHVGA